jgi:hypothetical protein
MKDERCILNITLKTNQLASMASFPRLTLPVHGPRRLDSHTGLAGRQNATCNLTRLIRNSPMSFFWERGTDEICALDFLTRESQTSWLERSEMPYGPVASAKKKINSFLMTLLHFTDRTLIEFPKTISLGEPASELSVVE